MEAVKIHFRNKKKKNKKKKTEFENWLYCHLVTLAVKLTNVLEHLSLMD